MMSISEFLQVLVKIFDELLAGVGSNGAIGSKDGPLLRECSSGTGGRYGRFADVVRCDDCDGVSTGGESD